MSAFRLLFLLLAPLTALSAEVTIGGCPYVDDQAPGGDAICVNGTTTEVDTRRHGSQFIYRVEPAGPDTVWDARGLYVRATSYGPYSINETVGLSSYLYHEGSGNLATAYGSTNQFLNRGPGTVNIATGSFNQARQHDFGGAITLARGSLNAAQNYRASGVGIVTGYGAHNRIEQAVAGGRIDIGYASLNEIRNLGGAIGTAVSLETSLNNSGTVENYAGLRINAPIGNTPTVTNYAINSLHPGKSFFAGNIGLNTQNVAQFNFRISSNITGATSAAALRLDGKVQGDVTSIGTGFTSAIGVAAGAAIPQLYHSVVDQGVFGAGASVADQYGYTVTSAMNGAARNYAFRHDLALDPNDWGFYGAGAAQNALAGKTRIGSTSTPKNTLDVTGSFGRGKPVVVTGDYAVGASDNWIVNNKVGSPLSVMLPAASSFPGRELYLTNWQATAAESTGSDVIPLAGGSAETSILPAADGAWAALVSDGTNWIITQAGE